MADSLDEFFAKKDKTRRGKKKNVTPEEIAKELEVGGRKSDKGQKDKDKSSAVPIVNLKILDAQEDEEWKDFEEEKEKDYSGLKIQALSIRDKEEELREQLQENGEDGKKDSQQGPWKKTQQTSAASTPIEEEEKEKEEEKPPTPVATPNVTTGGKYVPPHLRNANPSVSGSSNSLEKVSLSSLRKPKTGGSLLIADEAEFPSLGADPIVVDNKGFQTVKSGSRDIGSRITPTQVTLDNKFGALSGNSRDPPGSS